MDSPLIVTKSGNTKLDHITRAIYPVWALKILNTSVYERDPIYINWWSSMHVVYGIVCKYGGVSFQTMLVGHSMFEYVELILAGLKVKDVDTVEWTDIVFDSIFSFIGYYVV